MSISLEILLAFGALLYFLRCQLDPPFGGDILLAVKSGEYHFHNGFPLDYPFSWIPADCRVPWVNYQWLAQIVEYLTYEAGGLTGIVVYKILLYGAGFFILFRYSTGKNGLLAALIALFPAIYLGRHYFLLRPMLNSVLFSSLIAYILLNMKTGAIRLRHYAIMPAIFGIWANSHGGFLAGLLFLAGGLGILILTRPKAASPGNSRLRLLVESVGLWWICLLMTLLCTPYGPGAFKYNTDFMLTRKIFMEVCGDFKSPFLRLGYYSNNINLLIIFLAILLLIFCYRKWKIRPEIMELYVFSFWLLTWLRMERAVQLFAPAAIPIFAFLIHQGLLRVKPALTSPGTHIQFRKGLWDILKILLLFAILASFFFTFYERDLSFRSVERRLYPLGLKDFLLRNRLPERIYNYDVFGDMFMFYLYPRYKVSLDSSWNVAYSDKYYIEISRSFQDPALFYKFLDKYDPGTIILDARTEFLAGNPDFVLLYEAEGVRAYVRNSAKNRELLDRFRNDLLNYPDNYELNSFLYRSHIDLESYRTAKKYLGRLIVENPGEKILRDNMSTLNRIIEEQDRKNHLSVPSPRL